MRPDRLEEPQHCSAKAPILINLNRDSRLPTHFDFARRQQLSELAVQTHTHFALVGQLHVSGDVRHELVFRELLLVDQCIEDEDKRATGREEVIREVLGVFGRDAVVHDLERGRCNRLDCALDLRWRERAVNDVGCAHGLEVRLVVLRGGGYDGREAGQLRQLDSWRRR